jgi:hypothetical protein
MTLRVTTLYRASAMRLNVVMLPHFIYCYAECHYAECRYVSFSSKLENGPNKLECYSTTHWIGLLDTNTLVY